ncbi:hypothetical protein [Nocardia cyriacigeorgica]|uniref:Uncharacterized protein n=1 Tax=Nocardia cyriacigeorgica (strain GUH-2) TaxID=1127134 RepID=H6R9V6_NOCCG|nr:hypothetical protein [Nocardia cyriacigeorgica]CCF61164.1 protein of unknown function [Nocardia cyriacigeorgica GUH-2]
MFTNTNELGVPITDRSGHFIPRRAVDIRPHDHSADSVETQRERRRTGLSVHYDERLSLSTELADTLSGIHAQINADTIPRRWTGRVRETSVAITETLADIAAAVHRPAPAVPEPDLDATLSGAWAVALVNAAGTLDEALSGELRRPGRVVAGEPIGLWITERLRDIDREVRAVRIGLRAAATTDTPAPRSAEGNAWAALKRRHAAEVRELRDRHRAETAAFGAARRGRKIDGKKEVAG